MAWTWGTAGPQHVQDWENDLDWCQMVEQEVYQSRGCPKNRRRSGTNEVSIETHDGLLWDYGGERCLGVKQGLTPLEFLGALIYIH